MVGSNPWTLDYPGVSLAMNTGPSLFFTGPPEIGPAETRSDDAEGVREDGDDFGQDFKSGRTITFPIGLQAETETAVLDLEAAFSRAWDAERVRGAHRDLAALTAVNGGRTRVFYGRPRSYAPDYTYQHQGYISGVATFKTRDHLAYGAESVTSVGLIPGSVGGFTAPFTSPITMTAPSQRAAGVVVGGDKGAWLRAKISAGTGPLTNPSIQITNQWTLKLNMTLTPGMWVEFDARPWKRTILDNNGGSRAGSLDRFSRLRLARLEPGAYEAILKGTDATGTSTAEIRWQTTYASLGIAN